MHSDARTLPDGTVIQSDLCIIGAGPAGISIAREYIDSNITVTLLEAGGFERDPDVQKLYEGDNTGLPYFPLSGTRLRYFGGTSNHWNGWCSTLDPIDFEKRGWVPMSGWPLQLSDLQSYYRRAHPILDLGHYNYDLNYWRKHSEKFSSILFDGSVVETKIFKRSGPTRFREKYRSDITNGKNLTLWTHANLTDIKTTENNSKVERLKVCCINGKSHKVKASHYVLACGGLENPRLLLANDIGNDAVGRYFMEHPHVRSGHLKLTDQPSSAYFGPGSPGNPFALLSMSEEKQRNEEILNYTCLVRPKKYSRSLPEWVYQVPNMRGLEYYVRSSFGLESENLFEIDSRVEQRPNSTSRITLSNKTDALGQPRIELNWSLTEQEKRTIRVANETIGRNVGRQGIGRVRLAEWLTDKGETWPDTLRGGHHHMGTTRMSESPKQGVVNPNCRVHGVQNLFIAGSSVYPTSGTANPTLTLVALAIRLADRLKTEISR